MRNFQTMTEMAALELRRAILRGHLVPGARLIPAKLEEDMDLSRASIREAIRELVGTGLAESSTHKGAIVSEPLSLAEIKEVFRFRYQVEGRAAFLGTKRITEEGIAQLESLVLTVDEEIPVLNESFFINYEIHMTLYRATGWRYLYKMIERIFDQVIAFRGSLVRQLGQGKQPVSYEQFHQEYPFNPFHQDHLQILEAVKARDAAQARQVTVINLKRGLADIIEMHKRVSKQRKKNHS